MGFNIVNFSKTKKYKIIFRTLIGVSVFFFILGGLFSLMNIRTPVYRATEMNLSASGLVQDSLTEYSMKVYEQTTPIVVSTEPGNSSDQPVISTVTDGINYAETPNRTYPGGVVNVVLKKNGSVLPYGQKIEISIKCGHLTSILNITVDIPEEKVSFKYSLGHTRPGQINSFDVSNYLEYKQNSSLNYYCFFTPDLFINGIKVSGAAAWSAQEVEQPIGIELLQSEGAYKHIDIPQLLLEYINNYKVSYTVKFKITAKYYLSGTNEGDFKEYIDFYSLKIVP